MDNYLLNILKKTTEYIENNLFNNLNLDDISENVHVSKFHLLRIWKGATSTGLMEYVRKRRIALSLGDLSNHHKSIEFISSKYSFGCERSYSRAFKEEFNTTPAKWRKNPFPLKILDKFNVDFMKCAGDGLIFFHSITFLPKFLIAGYEYIINEEDNIKNQTATKYGIDFFYNKRHTIINPVEKDIYYGFTLVPSNYNGYTLYQPSLKINQSSIVPHDMIIKHILPHKYGVFKYFGLHAPEEITSITLKDIWKHVFKTWMPTIEFNLNETFSFEYIDYAKCNKNYCECDLYFPISIL